MNYDVQNWPQWLDNPDHRNNRLMGYELTNLGTVLEQVTYYYALEGVAAGNVYRIERQPVGPWGDDGQSSCITYNRAGEVWVVTQQHWLDGQPENSVVDRLVEFRGRGRQRYLVRDRDIVTLEPIEASAVWTAYDDGAEPVIDYNVQDDDYATLTRYILGMVQTDEATGHNSYFHTNHLGTTRAMTNDEGDVEATFVYTAFGERLDSGGFITRYAYVGEHGYEAFAGLPFLHVGARSYDPETGRFLQRDPIGIRGGLNVYGYVLNRPSILIDPKGLKKDLFRRVYEWIDAFINGTGMGATGSGIVAGGAANYKWKLGVGKLVNRAGVVCAGAWVGWNAGSWIYDNAIEDLIDDLWGFGGPPSDGGPTPGPPVTIFPPVDGRPWPGGPQP